MYHYPETLYLELLSEFLLSRWGEVAREGKAICSASSLNVIEWSRALLLKEAFTCSVFEEDSFSRMIQRKYVMISRTERTSCPH